MGTTMESYKIEVSTPKTPRISTLVQNVEQQMAILLRGKQKGQKSHEIAKKKKIPCKVGKTFGGDLGEERKENFLLLDEPILIPSVSAGPSQLT